MYQIWLSILLSIFTTLLSDNGLIHKDALFIDGTKIQADAKIYSFTWRKAIERYEAGLIEKVSHLYEELIQTNVDIALTEEELATSSGIEKIIDSLDVALDEGEDSYTDLDGVHFSFSHYSTRNDKNGFQRQFKVYKADTYGAYGWPFKWTSENTKR